MPVQLEVTQAAERGDAASQCKLAIKLARDGNEADAVRWATAAAAQGNLDALCFLADAHWAGLLGLQRNESTAVECWQRALGMARKAPAPVAVAADSSAAPCSHECCSDRMVSPAAPADGPALRVAIIGAGPSGLACLKECVARGFDVTVFELGPSVGGVFASAYEGARLTSSSAITTFGDFPDGSEAAPVFRTATEYSDYLGRYVDAFGLRPHIMLNTRVRSAKREVDGKWALQVAREDVGGKITSFAFDALGVCAGLHQKPVWPLWASEQQQHPRTTFVHSSSFGSASALAGKRVLIVGLGESGSDISLLVAEHAAAVAISTRGGPGAVVPRWADPLDETEPADLATNRRPSTDAWGPAEFAWLASSLRECRPGGQREAQLAQCFLGGGRRSFTALERDAIETNARHGNLPYDRFGTKNLSFLRAIREYGAVLHADVKQVLPDGTVEFQDGARFVDCDVVVLCTGFAASFPFFESDMPQLAQREADARGRFKHIFCPDQGHTLAFVGYARPAFGAVPPMSELGARYWAQLLAGERSLPDNLAEEIQRDREAETRLFRRDAQRLSSLVQYHSYMDSLGRLIGCMPNLRLLRRNHPGVYRRATESALCAAQYRLHGPGACEAAWQILSRLALPQHRRQPRCAALAKKRAMAASSVSPALCSGLWTDEEPPSSSSPSAPPLPSGALVVPTVCSDASDDDLVAAIQGVAGAGLLRLRDVSGAAAALASAQALFDSLGGILPASLDDGVSCKGAWLPADDCARRRVPAGDLKFLLDLESAALGSTQSAADLFPTLGGVARPALDFFDAMHRRFLPIVHEALARATGSAQVREEADSTVRLPGSS